VKEKLAEVIAFLKSRGASYADARHVHIDTETIRVRDASVDAVVRDVTEGVGIRVIADGAWGFAACSTLTPAALRRTATRALQVARASALTRRGEVRLAEAEAKTDSWRTPFRVDPFAVKLDRKLDLLLSVNEVLKRRKEIRVAESSMAFTRTRKLFVSTEGSVIEQDLVESGGGCVATAVDGGEVQRRSYPSSFGGDFGTGGYEIVEGLRLGEHAETVREEAVELLSAPPMPAGRFDVVLGGSQVALQVHESCGHPAELDRCSDRVSPAGGSFLTLDKAGSFRYGSNLVTKPTRPCPGRSAPSATTTRGSRGGSHLRNVRQVPRLETAVVISWPGRAGRARRRLVVIRRSDQRRPRRPGGRTTYHDHKRQPRGFEELVHRRPAAELPVRAGDRVEDRGREARAHPQESPLHRHDARLLGLVRRDLRPGRLALLWRRQLRQGRADAAGPRRPRRRARALPRPGNGGERMIGRDRIFSSIERALATCRADAAEAVVAAGTSATTRYAGSAIHQNMVVEKTTVSFRVALGTRVGTASCTSLGIAELRRTLRAATEIARRQKPNHDFDGFTRRRAARFPTPATPVRQPLRRSSGPRS
jgi:predicted Zn-dependent protease